MSMTAASGATAATATVLADRVRAGSRRWMPLGMARVAGAVLLAGLVGSIGLAAPSGPAVAKDVAPAQEAASAFGSRLAEAARGQISYLVLYDPSYRKLAYPGGDVPWYIGVCTDVVVRAYRKLGIDLQERVHAAHVGSGDTNIDHRRVPVLKTFFARHGRNLPVTRDAADYRPGDIVTYHLPDGRFSKTHIGIVSSQTSAAGVPLLVHNRGFGVHEEDWLFSERITGHYRYGG